MDHNQKPTGTMKEQQNFCASAINKIAAAMNVELSKATIAMYLDRLSQLPIAQMAEATRRTIDEWPEASKMPPLKFILDRTGDSPKLLAEQAWAFVEPLVEKNWYADGLGWMNDAQKKLSPAMNYAIRQCGGENRIATEASPFVRKDFIAAFERFWQENGQQNRLLQAEPQKELQGE